MTSDDVTHTPDYEAPRVLHMGASLPQLVFNYPTCGNCGEDVMIEDGCAWCEGCLVQWNRIEDGEIAVPDEALEGTSVPCGIVVGKQGEPHNDQRGNHYNPGPPQPCILPSGHENDHRCPYDVTVTRVLPPGSGEATP